MLELLSYSDTEIAVDDQRRLRQFLALQMSFILLSPVALQLFGLFSLDLYFVVSFVWFLSTSEVFAPRSPEVEWWAWVQWIKAGGFVVLAYVVTQHVMTVLQ